MPFHCLRCGECCRAMGDVHALVGDLTSGCIVVKRYTGERRRSRSIPMRPAFSPRRRFLTPARSSGAGGKGVLMPPGTTVADYLDAIRYRRYTLLVL
jgi:hypothetical protein